MINNSGFCYQQLSPSLVRLSKISKSPSKRFKIRPEMLIKDAAPITIEDEKQNKEDERLMLQFLNEAPKLE